VNKTFQILQASERFSKEQKARKISADDVTRATNSFGPVLGEQMKRDMSTGFAFWDSCSMLEQTDMLFSNEKMKGAFVQWALQTIYKTK
jgi:hypothetical protein